ncbi:MAG: protein kinase [bacterium]|nr:protein kinase [bacterium]
METCRSCGASLPTSDRFCPRCGTPLSAPAPGAADPTLPTPLDPTVVVPKGTAWKPDSPTLSPTSQVSGGRFVPGAMIAGRYRIVGLLGRGGMGEVYRAEDLTLGQEVALKFLPAGLERDPDRLKRFLNEARTARQVTHPNVCRVFDIGEVEGQHFLTMEYVDGEDLATSLVRIGRFPEERAVEIARQICAGLAAAHDQGILHRDLKPANVMLDGRGRVKLADFGLAGLAAGFDNTDVGVGTPAYMSPEQISGREVTERSDIYALGLVLYEMFTGKPAFRGGTVAEYRQFHLTGSVSQLSSHVQGLDPAVERAIMHCLEKEPRDRPASALGVSAALPGGDPLAAALAAGETPSPELVAESGNRAGMAPLRAVLLAAAAIVLLLGSGRWAGELSLANFAPLDKEPAVLMDRAQEVLKQSAYREQVYTHPVDRAWGFLIWGEVISEVAASDSSRSRWDALKDRPDVMSFWYRQSPDLLMPNPSLGPVFIRGPVSLTNPMPATPGEAIVVLDLQGRLRRFEVVPKRYSTGEPAEPDWSTLFALADLDTSRFKAVSPRYQRFMAPDLRRAWVGTRADQPAVELRVEAGAFEGRPVLFNVATQASLLNLGKDPEPLSWETERWVINLATPLIILVVVLVAVRTSRRNISQSHSDTRGAIRFGSLMFVLFLSAASLTSHSLYSRHVGDEIWPIIAGAMFVGIAGWSLYLAAEPLGRKTWPAMFVSSSRLLSRRRIQWRDPVIGQAILVGLMAAGLDFALRGPVRWDLLTHAQGLPPQLPWINTDLLAGKMPTLALLLAQTLNLVFAFIQIMILVLSRHLLKKKWPAIILALAVWTLIAGPGSPTEAGFILMSSAIGMFVLLRWGVVALAINRLALSLIWQIKPADWSSWHAQGSLLLVAVLVATTIWGTWAAMGERAPRR